MAAAGAVLLLALIPYVFFVCIAFFNANLLSQFISPEISLRCVEEAHPPELRLCL